MDKEKDESWYEHEDCEDCKEESEAAGVEYEANFTWENGCRVCDNCRRVQ